MEEQKVFDISDAFLASYLTDGRQCVHPNREHTLVYLCSGELEVEQEGRRTVLHEGECAFMRRDHRMILQRRVSQAKPYRSVALKFSRNFLREFYQRLDRRSLPAYAQRNRDSLYLLPADRPDIRNLFRSVLPFFETEVKPSEELLRLKMAEGVYVLLNTDKSLYASLFDFTDPWKIDLMDFMEQNFMDDLSLEEMASYTGRSLSTFKRDFRKYSELTPQRWIIRRRLEAACELLRTSQLKVSEVCGKVGFKNLSHFSKIYKERYGVAPTEMRAER
ncbi:AraC family transcriptional regulator [uncultured Bacteroides sp.]|uniref:AraC family transcriptional regulator n=1 Tax=uncultured Bacteroides sp. TaxID=162156 RepID=UPI00280AEFAE|nr:AraC family transcriptional regulator [uncultured Bacteroides sp.]